MILSDRSAPRSGTSAHLRRRPQPKTKASAHFSLLLETDVSTVAPTVLGTKYFESYELEPSKTFLRVENWNFVRSPT